MILILPSYILERYSKMSALNSLISLFPHSCQADADGGLQGVYKKRLSE